MSDPDPARWYDYVMLAGFVLHVLGALFFGGEFLRQKLWVRLVWALSFTALMFVWIIAHRV